MQAFERKDKRDKHQASIHALSLKSKCLCPQCEETVERYSIWNSLLICNTGIIYLSTSCVSTRDVSSAQEPLSPSAHIAARCGRASASQVLTPVSTLSIVSGSSSALTGIHILLRWNDIWSLMNIFVLKLIYLQHLHRWQEWGEPWHYLGYSHHPNQDLLAQSWSSQYLIGCSTFLQWVEVSWLNVKTQFLMD